LFLLNDMTLILGTRLGMYEITSLLGGGGMGARLFLWTADCKRR
jgi:hypothetical protein